MEYGKLKKYENVTKKCKIMVKKPFFASTEPLFNFTIMQNGHKINSSKQQRGMCRTHTRQIVWEV